MNNLKNWAFRRPFCTPEGGFVLANSSEEAVKLIHFAFGYCSNTKVYCAETETHYIDKPQQYHYDDEYFSMDEEYEYDYDDV